MEHFSRPSNRGQGFFLRTVVVRFSTGTEVSVSSAEQALRLLNDHQWPDKTRAAYAKAVEICRHQVSVKAATAAEHAFRAAASDAGMLS